MVQPLLDHRALDCPRSLSFGDQQEMTSLNYLTDTLGFIAIVAMCAALYWVG